MQDSERLSDIELLKFYAKAWTRYTDGASYVNKLFNYLNKHWVKREKDEGRKEVYTVYTVSLRELQISTLLTIARTRRLEGQLLQVLPHRRLEYLPPDSSSASSDRGTAKR